MYPYVFPAGQAPLGPLGVSNQTIPVSDPRTFLAEIGSNCDQWRTAPGYMKGWWINGWLEHHGVPGVPTPPLYAPNAGEEQLATNQFNVEQLGYDIFCAQRALVRAIDAYCHQVQIQQIRQRQIVSTVHPGAVQQYYASKTAMK